MHSKQKTPLDALDGSKRTEFPDPEWQNQTLNAMCQALILFNFTVSDEIKPLKLRTLTRDFADKANKMRVGILNKFPKGHGMTWELARQYSVGLADLFKEAANEILEGKYK